MAVCCLRDNAVHGQVLEGSGPVIPGADAKELHFSVREFYRGFDVKGRLFFQIPDDVEVGPLQPPGVETTGEEINPYEYTYTDDDLWGLVHRSAFFAGREQTMSAAFSLIVGQLFRINRQTE